MTYEPYGLSTLMAYEPLALRHTHDLPRVGLSARGIYRAWNVMSHAET
jgi:hypothetical protein